MPTRRCVPPDTWRQCSTQFPISSVLGALILVSRHPLRQEVAGKDLSSQRPTLPAEVAHSLSDTARCSTFLTFCRKRRLWGLSGLRRTMMSRKSSPKTRLPEQTSSSPLVRRPAPGQSRASLQHVQHLDAPGVLSMCDCCVSTLVHACSGSGHHVDTGMRSYLESPGLALHELVFRGRLCLRSALTAHAARTVSWIFFILFPYLRCLRPGRSNRESRIDRPRPWREGIRAALEQPLAPGPFENLHTESAGSDSFHSPVPFL